jgi:predicted dehydrogenase
MNKSLLIIGAGSIGNHHAYAAKKCLLNVSVYDIDKNSLNRMKNEIYPQRYGAWDESISLFYNLDEIKQKYFDVVIIGTPPDVHLENLDFVMKNVQCKIILIEKPFSKPLGLEFIKIIENKVMNAKPRIMIGYNHRLTKLTERFLEKIKSSGLSNPQFVTCLFQESWEGIFSAHPWLQGPADSYLGYLSRGGGAAFEHSHAINLFLYITDIIGAGEIVFEKQFLNMTNDDQLDYDHFYSGFFRTKNNVSGIVVQVVFTKNHKKSFKIDFINGSIEWIHGYEKSKNAIIYNSNGKSEIELMDYERPEDFMGQMSHIVDILNKPYKDSPLDFKNNIQTQILLEKLFESK